jgi:uncharacterized membrane protein YoaK (UPF0700 family)
VRETATEPAHPEGGLGEDPADPATPRPIGGVRPSPRTLTVIAVLLTFASGASDVASFTRLGNVFTSVMTGNMVVFGLSLAQGSISLAAHTVVAFCGYVVGVAAGTRITWRHAQPSRVTGNGHRTVTDADQPPENERPLAEDERQPAEDKPPTADDERQPAGGQWPPHLLLTLLAELTLLIAVVIGWLVTGTHPAGAAQLIILVLAACAMGIQSAAVRQMGLGNVSTTYLTGTLTGLVSAIARPDGTRAGRRRPAVLLGLLAGATLAGLFVAYAAAVTPFLPLVAVAAAAALESGQLSLPPLSPSPPHGTGQ